ncbi:hypothetical protein Runsl_1451 [Runella slithyformis DSM 19594]|uniref:Uncharacterized protein n=1 Tax=Runella slithyformis (strain ATCC 29530 / DSM 19594 / LMG 11500 / NCIMB 11436 / LSU 4) TaxID=761193 RepID=A0A7U3ZIL4_RUNSL|nr:hypothetical protein Runsl_1451 [Runella slithyformis DSM 19594]
MLIKIDDTNLYVYTLNVKTLQIFNFYPKKNAAGKKNLPAAFQFRENAFSGHFSHGDNGHGLSVRFSDIGFKKTAYF